MRLFLDTANVDGIRQAVKLGAISGVTTMPPRALNQMVEHPLTDQGLSKFSKDWEGAAKS